MKRLFVTTVALFATAFSVTASADSAAPQCLDSAKAFLNSYKLPANNVQFLGRGNKDVESAKQFGLEDMQEFYLASSDQNLVVTFRIHKDSGKCDEANMTFGPKLNLPADFVVAK